MRWRLADKHVEAAEVAKSQVPSHLENNIDQATWRRIVEISVCSYGNKARVRAPGSLSGAGVTQPGVLQLYCDDQRKAHEGEMHLAGNGD